MKADYKNWVPKGMIYGFGATAAGLAAVAGVIKNKSISALLGAVTSNYVYHNITGKNKQVLLRETLRVLKKGGTFAIHDLMEPARYGDMEKFAAELKAEGYEDVRLIKTTNGMFMNPGEAKMMMLAGSTLLVGKK